MNIERRSETETSEPSMKVQLFFPLSATATWNPKVLIFDDSTSAVDLETEAKIQEIFDSLEDVTVILVAQRISTALGADEIDLVRDTLGWDLPPFEVPDEVYEFFLRFA